MYEYQKKKEDEDKRNFLLSSTLNNQVNNQMQTQKTSNNNQSKEDFWANLAKQIGYGKTATITENLAENIEDSLGINTNELTHIIADGNSRSVAPVVATIAPAVAVTITPADGLAAVVEADESATIAEVAVVTATEAATVVATEAAIVIGNNPRFRPITQQAVERREAADAATRIREATASAVASATEAATAARASAEEASRMITIGVGTLIATEIVIAEAERAATFARIATKSAMYNQSIQALLEITDFVTIDTFNTSLNLLEFDDIAVIMHMVVNAPEDFRRLFLAHVQYID